MRQRSVWLRRSGRRRVASAVNEAVATLKRTVYRYLRHTRAQDRETREFPLFALKNEAGDVVGLPRRANKVIDLTHQVLKGLGRTARRKIANRIEPAAVSKLITRFVECFDDAIRKHYERVAGAHGHGRGFVGRAWLDSERQATFVEKFHRLVRATQHRCVMARVDIDQFARHRVV